MKGKRRAGSGLFARFVNVLFFGLILLMVVAAFLNLGGILDFVEIRTVYVLLSNIAFLNLCYMLFFFQENRNARKMASLATELETVKSSLKDIQKQVRQGGRAGSTVEVSDGIAEIGAKKRPVAELESNLKPEINDSLEGAPVRKPAIPPRRDDAPNKIRTISPKQHSTRPGTQSADSDQILRKAIDNFVEISRKKDLPAAAVLLPMLKKSIEALSPQLQLLPVYRDGRLADNLVFYSSSKGLASSRDYLMLSLAGTSPLLLPYPSPASKGFADLAGFGAASQSSGIRLSNLRSIKPAFLSSDGEGKWRIKKHGSVSIM